MSVYRLGDLCEMGAHGRCPGGHHQEGLLGGWDCSCRCHRQQDQPKERKVSYLTTRDIHALNHACSLIREGLDMPYLVGSSTERPDYRDVDVRVILADDEFDTLFSRQHFWSLFCFLAGDWLSRQTGLPVDFQVQRRTEANEKHPNGKRNACGMRARLYAGGGDATPSQPPDSAQTDSSVTEAVGPGTGDPESRG